MKKLIVLVTILALAIPSFAQQDDNESERSGEIHTIMGKNNTVGGYGAISIGYTEIQDRDAFVFGARGAVLIGHMMSIGLAGSGFFNDVENVGLDQNVSLAGGYGGFYFEPIVLPRYPVHISFPILIGAGGVALVSVDDDDNWKEHYKTEASDAFMVIEPGAEIELNVTRFFRFCVGVHYRYTTDVNIDDPDYPGIPTDVLKGFSGGVTFKFGRF